MGCPMYKDFTRECITRFGGIIHFSSFDICEADGYRDCPFYRVINKIEPICEYAEKCSIYFFVGTFDFGELIAEAKKYCFSKNYENCERYKLRKAGKEPPKELYPDGSIVELKA